jgi:hypothetical protein
MVDLDNALCPLSVLLATTVRLVRKPMGFSLRLPMNVHQTPLGRAGSVCRSRRIGISGSGIK